MKSVFDPSTRQELTHRIQSLGADHKGSWGKMDISQMVRHCTLCEEMFLGELKIKRSFMGRLFGPMVLKKVLKDDKPFGRNSPTSPVLITPKLTGDLENEKNEWIQTINRYANYGRNDFIHPFFGPMTREQVGLFAYKHADHHLRQFGV